MSFPKPDRCKEDRAKTRNSVRTSKLGKMSQALGYRITRQEVHKYNITIYCYRYIQKKNVCIQGCRGRRALVLSKSRRDLGKGSGGAASSIKNSGGWGFCAMSNRFRDQDGHTPKFSPLSFCRIRLRSMFINKRETYEATSTPSASPSSITRGDASCRRRTAVKPGIQHPRRRNHRRVLEDDVKPAPKPGASSPSILRV